MSDLENRDWFFLGGDLHKKLTVDRAKNQIKAYNYTEQRPKMLMLSEVKKYKRPAFDVSQTGFILNRSRRTIYYYIENELFIPSGKSDKENITDNAKWWFSDEDVLKLRDIIHENSMNNYAPKPIPTREEVRAITRIQKMLYIEEGGKFIPVYKAKTW